jgi:hypothetical protein
MSSDLPASFYRAESAYLQPPEHQSASLQVEGCFEISDWSELSQMDTGEIEEITIIDSGFDPETDILKIWISGWISCSPDGEFEKSDLGDLKDHEIVDTENVDFGPDPDEEYDRRGEEW